MLSRKKLILLSSLLLSFSASAGIFGPSNYEECILDKMQGTKSNVAANAIKRACRKEFPSKEAKRELVALPKSELKKIKASGSIVEDILGDLKFEAKVYNGTDWHLERVKISVRNDDTEESLSYNGHFFSDSGIGLKFSITPNQSGKITVSDLYEKPRNYSWYLIEVMGYKN
ncbi:hypothetical protein [Alteromonas mediterranea]|uniref:hypothetical protein n=1 Tax=Alteromonas mediterranea TaxID=314275 RepID=UPI000A670804|nr:hypothetical protein [Alteromonas mediterranea]